MSELSDLLLQSHKKVDDLRGKDDILDVSYSFVLLLIAPTPLRE